jgi:hypothetical protein
MQDTKELNGLPDITATTSTVKTAEEEEVKKERDKEVVARALEQREYRIRELVESEQDYVADLAQCVQYIKFMRSVDAQVLRIWRKSCCKLRMSLFPLFS